MKFKTQDEINADKFKHRTWVLFYFTVFLGLVIIGLCVYIHKHTNYSKQNKKLQKMWMEEHSSSNGFRAKELAKVTNMRPLYVVQGKR